MERAGGLIVLGGRKSARSPLSLNYQSFTGGAAPEVVACRLRDSLAEVYERSGDRARATENYRRSLELDPGNAHAAEQLKSFQGSGD